MKKTFAIIMSVLMIACFMPTMAFAEGETAVHLPDAASNGVITLTDNIEISDAEVLDLTGKTITTNGYKFVIKEGGSLTVNGQGTIKSEKVATKKEIFGTFLVKAGGSLTINDGTFETKTAGIIVSSGTVTISNGTFRADYDTEKDYTDSYWVFAITGEGAILNMTGGSISAGTGADDCGLYGIYASNGAVVNLGKAGTEGPTVTSYCAPLGCNHDTATGTYNVYSGTYESTWTGGNTNYNYFHGAIYAACKGSVNIAGGTFKGEYGVAIPYDNVGLQLTISGGDFAQLTKGTINESHKTVSGDTETNTATITGGTFSDLSALDYLGENANVTVKLAKAESRTEKIIISGNKAVTLDLNGQTLTVTNANTNGSAIEVCGSLIIDDSTNEKAGKLVANGNMNYGVYCRDGGTVTVNAGTIEATASALGGNNNTESNNFVVNGGTLTAGAGPAIYMPGEGNLTVTGGTLNGGISLRMGQVNISGGTINAITTGIDKPNEYYKYAGNAWLPDALYVFGGTYTSKTASNALDLNITGGTFNCTNSQGSAVAIYDLGKVAQTMNVNISGSAKLTTNSSMRKAYDVLSLSDIGVTTPATGFGNSEYVGKVKTAVTGGTFSTDPAKYLANSRYYTTKNSDGAYTVRYSAPSSSSSSTVTPSTDNVSNTTEDKKTDTGSTAETSKVATTTATVKAETKTATDGTKTTTATVDNTTATKIVEKAVENKSEEVVVNTATAATVTETAAGTKTEVALPAETITQVAEKTEAAVTIKSDAAEVKLDKEAVKAVAEAAGTTGEVKLEVKTVAQNETKVEVDLKLVTSAGTVSDFKGGNVTVTVKLNTKLAAKPVVCVYIDDNGTYHKVKGVKNADGTYTFETGHFSTYAVMAEEEADKVIAEQTANVDKLVSALTLKARSAKTKAGNIKVTLTADDEAIKAIEDLGYTVKYKFYRSTKKGASYKAKLEGTGKTYTNTTGKKGTKYYYKARVMVYDAQGEVVAKSALTQCKYASRTK